MNTTPSFDALPPPLAPTLGSVDDPSFASNSIADPSFASNSIADPSFASSGSLQLSLGGNAVRSCQGSASKPRGRSLTWRADSHPLSGEAHQQQSEEVSRALGSASNSDALPLAIDGESTPRRSAEERHSAQRQQLMYLRSCRSGSSRNAISITSDAAHLQPPPGEVMDRSAYIRGLERALNNQLFFDAVYTNGTQAV